MVYFIGAGGKTTTLFYLANVARSRFKQFKSFQSFKPSERNGFVAQLERIDRFERLEHARAEGVPSW
ncbi:MAG TPA: hypothetical protein VGB27_01065 [Candidatus Binatia bacterium]